jgi:hypothetical protein
MTIVMGCSFSVAEHHARACETDFDLDQIPNKCAMSIVEAPLRDTGWHLRALSVGPPLLPDQ